MNKVYCYCYHPCTTIVHFLFSEKACSCTFGIPTNKAFKLCLKGTKKSHSYLNSFFDPDVDDIRIKETIQIRVRFFWGVENVLKCCPWIISPSDRGCRPLVRPVQGGIPTHSYTTTHARTHARTHTQLIRDKEAQDGHLDFHTAP